MKSLKLFFIVTLYAIAFASVIPHLFPHYWLTDLFSHFKLQYIFLLLILLLPGFFFLMRRRIFPVALILILLLWNSWFIVPLYLPSSDKAEVYGASFSILSMNLLASNTNYSEAIDLIGEKDPDVVVLLELNPQWEKEMQILESKFPFRKMYPQTNNFGIGIFSKYPGSFTVTDFGKGFPPSIIGETEINGSPISILATHPFPPVSQEKFLLRNKQLKEIAELTKSRKGNLILVGDLNTSSYSPNFQELLKKGDLKDSRKGFGIASTWPVNYLIVRTTLDHILYKGKLQVIKRTTERSIGSDHLPIYMEFGL